ncbi:MAG: hypothetical protein QGH40_10265 [bacterium]|jgi:hypothetical protein|nr:hypothetical protein [bacterium]|tara:strand:- start:119 stop:247 length:129 start_codon:yes stop_codon:yes gene_type:complete
MNPEMIFGWAYLIFKIALFAGIIYVAVKEIKLYRHNQDDESE